MVRKNFASNLFYRAILFFLFFVAAAVSFNGFYNKWHFREAGACGSLPKAGFIAMVEGTADRPLIYRQLLPMLANSLDRLVPEHTKDWLFAFKSKSGIPLRERFFDSPVAQNRTYFLRYLTIYILSFLFAWISVFAMYMVGRSAGYAPSTAALAAIVMILLIPFLMTRGGYFYDYPELAFFALAVWMALNFDWWWMIPVVALATLNKESFLFFIPALYPLMRQRSSRRGALAGTGIMGLISAAVSCVIRSHFQHNPGVMAERHFLEQIIFTLNPINLLTPVALVLYFRLRQKTPRINMLAGIGVLALACATTLYILILIPGYTEITYGMNLIRSFNPLSVILIVWIVWRGWPSLPRPIQRHARIAASINIPLYLLLGYPGELRGLSLLYITLLLLLAANMDSWTGAQSSASAQPQS